MLLVDNQECFPDTVADVGHTVVHKSHIVPDELVGEVTDEYSVRVLSKENCRAVTHNWWSWKTFWRRRALRPEG